MCDDFSIEEGSLVLDAKYCTLCANMSFMSYWMPWPVVALVSKYFILFSLASL